MSLENQSQPELQVGSKDWIQTLSVRNTEDGKAITSLVEDASREVLGESFSEEAWDTMFLEKDSMHSKARGHARTASTMITIAQKFNWNAYNPEFRYTSAQLVVHLAEKLRPPRNQEGMRVFKLVEGERVEIPPKPPVEVPLDAMTDQLQAYAAEHYIGEDRQMQLRWVAATPLLNSSRKTRALDRLQKYGPDGLINYMTPLE